MVVSIFMSLTVFDVTVGSSAIIVLSMITLLLVTKNRYSDATKSHVVRVDSQDPKLSVPTADSWNIRSVGVIGITSIFSGVVLAVFISVTLAVLISKLTGLIGQ